MSRRSARVPTWWFGLARVSGGSMIPTLRPGDLILVSYRRAPQEGDVVVARLPDGAVAVKRATDRRTTRTGEPGWWLLSDNPAQGVDSRHRGVIAATEVRAVARARLWPRPRRL